MTANLAENSRRRRADPDCSDSKRQELLEKLRTGQLTDRADFIGVANLYEESRVIYCERLWERWLNLHKQLMIRLFSDHPSLVNLYTVFPNKHGVKIFLNRRYYDFDFFARFDPKYTPTRYVNGSRLERRIVKVCTEISRPVLGIVWQIKTFLAGSPHFLTYRARDGKIEASAQHHVTRTCLDPHEPKDEPKYSTLWTYPE